MFSPIARCTGCGEFYDPVEYATVPQDPDEIQFCSTECEDRFRAAEDAEQAYREAGTGAPVW